MRATAHEDGGQGPGVGGAVGGRQGLDHFTGQAEGLAGQVLIAQRLDGLHVRGQVAGL